jgi:hypothetical protein
MTQKSPTPLQRKILAQITRATPLCHGPGSGSGSGHWYFHGSPARILSGTGRSMLKRGWIRALPRRKDQPFWLTEYDLTDSGQEARDL